MLLPIALLLLSTSLYSQGQELGFVETPHDINSTAGDVLLLKCKGNATVEECQWSWKSLEDISNLTLTVVKQYPAFGDEMTDCSARFGNVLVEQQGFWICSIRSNRSNEFVTSPPAKILVSSYELQFSEVTKDADMEAGRELLLTCKITQPVRECQWIWRPLLSINDSELTVKTFPAFGNGSQDCSIRLKSLKLEQEGLWVCGARKNSENNFTTAHPIEVRVHQPSEVEFSELTSDTEVSVGKPLLITCRTTKPVEECQWTFKSTVKTDKTPEVVMKQFPSFGNDSHDCSIHFDNVVSEQEGVWTCGARFRWQTQFTTAHSLQLTVFTGVAFVQLSQDIQAAIGEPVLLRCVTNTAVELCQWNWKPLNSINETTIVMKQFPSFGEEGRDCSIRFKNVLEEQEGIWSCSVRLYTHSTFTTASPPATLTLLPAVRLKFLERPEDVREPVGESALLRCTATTVVNECQWTWRPLSGAKSEVVKKRFSGFGNYSRDCSLHFSKLLKEDEGLWGCSVLGPPNFTLLTAPPAKLTVYEPVPINFVQLSQDIQMPPGGPLLLRCTTERVVEECKWTWKPRDESNNTEVIVKQFLALGNRSRDCSMHFDSVLTEHEGNWTCAARNVGETHFTSAPPARLTLLQPESVMVALWSAPEHKVTLACRLSAPRPTAVCHWQHPPDTTVKDEEESQRFSIEYNTRLGICTIIFAPVMEDLGQWSCIFTINDWELASATLVLLTTPPDEKLSWLVGVLAAMVLILTIVLVAVAVCKCRRRNSTKKSGLGNPVLPGKAGDKKNPDRYTNSPSKINFQFQENSGRAASTSAPVPPRPPPISPKPSHHIYERVDRYVSPSTCKSIYENVE